MALASSEYAFLGALGGAEVVGAVEVDRVDLIEVDEVLELSIARVFFGASASISAFLERHVVAGGDLEGLG